jgi:hypothetical protein
MFRGALKNVFFETAFDWIWPADCTTGVLWVCLVLFPGMHPSRQAPSGQALSMQSVVVWLRGHPESG